MGGCVGADASQEVLQNILRHFLDRMAAVQTEVLQSFT